MMQNVYFGCAAVGGAILVLQTLASMLGMGHHDADAGIEDVHDHDFDHGHEAHAAHDGDAFVKLFTFKTIVAFLTFFGLAGLASERSGAHGATTFVIALLAGSLALYCVAWLMKTMSRLQSKGNVKLGNAVGLSAKVYLRIPPRGEGMGKVTVEVQGRSIEAKRRDDRSRAADRRAGQGGRGARARHARGGRARRLDGVKRGRTTRRSPCRGGVPEEK